MHNTLLLIHSFFRWLVIISLLSSVIIAANGYFNKKLFTSFHNHLRHWTATICHIQLMIGIILYTQSPAVKYYFSAAEKPDGDSFFFSVLHIALMLMAIVVITVGSAKAKREENDTKKYKTMLYWFSAGLLIIFIAIPWPFSPLSSRPLIRI